MKIAVLCIATNFKVRMKIGNKALLMQEEKRAMGKILEELGIWIANSDENLVPVIITCFDEIYEMSVQKHFVSFKNEFGFISESQVIRYGINEYPDADAYFIVSTSDTKTFRAEIFETLLNNMKNILNKIVISLYQNKLSLPMAFPKQFVENVKSIVDNNNGRFILHANSKYAVNFDITEELISRSNFHKNFKIENPNPNPNPNLKTNPNPNPNPNLNSNSNSNPNNDTNTDTDNSNTDNRIDTDILDKNGQASSKPNLGSVVIIRGGGRLASSIAIVLYQHGYKVLITENQIPTTIYRGMSFAQAVLTSEIEIEGIRTFLVSPNQIQIEKAWDSNVIPVVIDPSVEVLKLFDQTNEKKSLYADNCNENPVFDILKYLKNNNEQSNINTYTDKYNDEKISASDEKIPACEKNEIECAEIAFLQKYNLIALIDATSNNSQKCTERSMAPLTVSLGDDGNLGEDTTCNIKTQITSQYGKISYNKESQVSQNFIDKSDTGDKSEDENCSDSLPLTPVTVYSLDDGIYNCNRKIGDEIEKYSVIGKIENIKGDNVQITAPVKGRIVANALSGGHFKIGDELLVIDPSGIAKEDCFRTMPIDKTVAYSVLFLLENQN